MPAARMSNDWVKWGTDLSSYAKNAVQNATTIVAGSELEKKLAEATSNEPWGASGKPCALWLRAGVLIAKPIRWPTVVAGTLSAEIARFTYGYDDFKSVSLPTLLPHRTGAALALSLAGRVAAGVASLQAWQTRRWAHHREIFIKLTSFLRKASSTSPCRTTSPWMTLTTWT